MNQLQQYWRWIWQIGKLYWLSKEKWKAISIASVYILLIIIANNVLLKFNHYLGRTSTALQAKSNVFYHLTLITTGLIALYVLSYILRYYVQQKLELYWREWLNQNFLQRYFDNRAYYKINNNKQIDNPDERLSEDIESFVSNTIFYSFDLGDTVFRGFLFIGSLWKINHFFVFLTIAIATFRTLISVLIGKSLIPLRDKKLKLKPDFRYSLVNVRNNSETIAFYGGEKQELKVIRAKFTTFLAVLHQTILPKSTLSAFELSISIGSGLIPQLILAPEYFAGKIQFGDIASSLSAFGIVLGVFSWFANSFDGLTSYASVVKRLGIFKDFLEQYQPVVQKGEIIQTIIDQRLAINQLTLQTPDYKRTLVKNLSFEVAPGEGILLMGASGSGKSSILRAISGLWDSGCGNIYRPHISEIFFLPQRPYMILGSLRAQLLYPHYQQSINDDQLQLILNKVNLSNLVEQVGGFDTEKNWADILSLGEQQRLGFARLVLTNPAYAVLDEPTSGLDIDTEKQLYEMVKDLNMTFISVGHRPNLAQYHKYVIEILDQGNWRIFSS